MAKSPGEKEVHIACECWDKYRKNSKKPLRNGDCNNCFVKEICLVLDRVMGKELIIAGNKLLISSEKIWNEVLELGVKAQAERSLDHA